MNLAVKEPILAVKVAVKMWLKEDDVEKKEKKEKCGTHQRWCGEEKKSVGHTRDGVEKKRK